MEFKGHKAIYLQIADRILEKILMKDFVNGERIPSIRDTAISMEVNPNTVTRTYNYLQDQSIIFNKRGVGYFLNQDALLKTRTMKKQEFLDTELPRIIKTLTVLGIDFEELKSLITNYKNKNHEKA